MPNLTVGVAIMTHCAKLHLPKCLPPYLNAKAKPRVLVINTSSDGTLEAARAMGAETLAVARHEFNHGLTRELARRHLGTDIVIMATPDAYAEDDTADKLIQPLLEQKASVSYARQLPHDEANIFASFARSFNYPAESHIRGLADIEQYGVYAFFCSNSCAAYRSAALDEIGGFPHVLLGEDTVAVAKLLQLGHSIAYVAEARVRHSHSYSLKQEFQRNFDIGLARRSYQHLLAKAGKDQKRGLCYTLELARHLLKKAPHLLPYGALQTASKLCGYTLGQAATNAPRWLKKLCSSQDFYWSTH